MRVTFKPHRQHQCPVNCPGTKAYYYIGWSPHNACVFAALNETSLELWNLSTSIMEPVLTKKPGQKWSLEIDWAMKDALPWCYRHPCGLIVVGVFLRKWTHSMGCLCIFNKCVFLYSYHKINHFIAYDINYAHVSYAKQISMLNNFHITHLIQKNIKFQK